MFLFLSVELYWWGFFSLLLIALLDSYRNNCVEINAYHQKFVAEIIVFVLKISKKKKVDFCEIKIK